MPTCIKSFGFKHPLTVEGVVISDGNPKWRPLVNLVVSKDGRLLVCDVRRFMHHNPFYNKHLRELRGDHPDVIKDLEGTPDLASGYLSLFEVVKEFNGPVYVGCTGGHHRSVYIADRLAADLGMKAEHLNYNDN